MATDITLAITTHNRPAMTFDAFEQVLDHEAITEILIVDDCSELSNQTLLSDLIKTMPPKVHLITNLSNLGCYHNKRNAVARAQNDWVILLDSDNVIDNSYVDALVSEIWRDNLILAPEFARPHFDYRGFTNQTIDSENVRGYVSQNKFDCLINTCNYFVNREWYLKVWQDHKEPWTADTLFHNYNHLKAGGKIKVVKDMQYEHLVHDGSHYKENMHKTNGMREEYMKKLETL